MLPYILRIFFVVRTFLQFRFWKNVNVGKYCLLIINEDYQHDLLVSNLLILLPSVKPFLKLNQF